MITHSTSELQLFTQTLNVSSVFKLSSNLNLMFSLALTMIQSEGEKYCGPSENPSHFKYFAVYFLLKHTKDAPYLASKGIFREFIVWIKL